MIFRAPRTLWEAANFDPGITGIASLVLGGLGAVTSAVGAIGTGEAQSQAAAYQAQVARNNATIASQNAEYATRAGQEKATEASLQARAQLGGVRAAEAANNIDVNTGTAADVQTGVAEGGELNTQQTVADAALKAYGYRTQATNFVAQSQLEEQQSQSDATAGFITGGGDLLSGASSLGFKWGQFQNPTSSSGEAWP